MEITVGVSTENTERAFNRFLDQLLTETERENQRTLQTSRRILKIYPPKLPRQRYQRTGRLGRSWVITPAGRGKWTLSNNARSPRPPRKRYAQWVVGNAKGEQQARIHRGRWPIARRVVLQEKAKAVKRLSRAIRTVAARVGL